MSYLCALAALILFLRPLPSLLLPPPRRETDFIEILENFVDLARAGTPTALSLHQALAVDFVPNEELAELIELKFPTIDLAQQFALMWRTLHQRGAGIVEGADRLALIGRARRAQDEELKAKTSGARATFRLLVLLPLWFLVVGQLAGLTALETLLTHPWGYLLLAFGGLMMRIGWRWMNRILAAV